MDLKTCALLAEYNRKTNREMDAIIAGLSEGEWTKDLGGHFGSIHGVANHLYIGDLNWLKRFSTLRPFDYAASPVLSRELGLESKAFGSVAEYCARREELDSLISRFVSELRDEDLSRYLDYRNFRGVDQHRLVGGLVVHLFNHQTHHRGMISLYLEQLGIDNDYSNLLYMV